jgi:hypothetical protein
VAVPRHANFLGALACASLLCAAPARAERAIAVSYSADPSCPSAEQFFAAVREKVSDVALAAATGGAPDAVVVLRSSGREFIGRLEVHQPGGDYVREATAALCDEAASVLAFVLALATAEKQNEAGPAPDKPRPSAVLPEVPPAPPIRQEPSPPWHVGAGLELGVRGAAAPSTSVTEAAFALAVGPMGGYRLGIARSVPTTYAGPDWTARFAWIAARAEACPVSFSLAKRVSALPCLGAHVGEISTTGSASTPGATGIARASLWLDAFAAARLELRPTDWLSVDAGVQVLVPLRHYEFAFDDPDTRVYDVPWLGVGASLGLAMQIW